MPFTRLSWWILQQYRLGWTTQRYFHLVHVHSNIERGKLNVYFYDECHFWAKKITCTVFYAHYIIWKLWKYTYNLAPVINLLNEFCYRAAHFISLYYVYIISNDMTDAIPANDGTFSHHILFIINCSDFTIFSQPFHGNERARERASEPSVIGMASVSKQSGRPATMFTRSPGVALLSTCTEFQKVLANSTVVLHCLLR